MSVWRHERVRLPWGRLNLYIAGTGPPLLLLHGLGGSGRYWAGIAPELAASRRLIAPDLAGFGRSDKPRATYDAGFHVAAIEGLLAAYGIDETEVAGHSMGGILAALLAARRPGLVTRLAVVASPFPRPQERPLNLPRTLPRRVLYRTLQALLPVIAPLVRAGNFPRAVVADYLRHTVESYDRTSQALIWDTALADEVRSLATSPRPTFLLFSDEDTTIHRDSLEKWRAALPQAEWQVVPGGHQLLLRDGFAPLSGWFGSSPGEAADSSMLHPTHTAV